MGCGGHGDIGNVRTSGVWGTWGHWGPGDIKGVGTQDIWDIGIIWDMGTSAVWGYGDIGKGGRCGNVRDIGHSGTGTWGQREQQGWGGHGGHWGCGGHWGQGQQGHGDSRATGTMTRCFKGCNGVEKVGNWGVKSGCSGVWGALGEFGVRWGGMGSGMQWGG